MQQSPSLSSQPTFLLPKAKLRKIHNLASGAINYHSPSCSPTEAVAYAYAEENNLLSLWSQAVQANDFSSFPIKSGKLSIACGNWATLS